MNCPHNNMKYCDNPKCGIATMDKGLFKGMVFAICEKQNPNVVSSLNKGKLEDLVGTTVNIKLK